MCAEMIKIKKSKPKEKKTFKKKNYPVIKAKQNKTGNMNLAIKTKQKHGLNYQNQTKKIWLQLSKQNKTWIDLSKPKKKTWLQLSNQQKKHGSNYQKKKKHGSSYQNKQKYGLIYQNQQKNMAPTIKTKQNMAPAIKTKQYGSRGPFFVRRSLHPRSNDRSKMISTLIRIWLIRFFERTCCWCSMAGLSYLMV